MIDLLLCFALYIPGNIIAIPNFAEAKKSLRDQLIPQAADKGETVHSMSLRGAKQRGNP
jgi:hypothetical protein